MSDHPDYLGRNTAAWEAMALEYVERGRVNWAADPSWGIWSIPDTDLRILDDASGKETLELGCGTGYISAWLARRGARPIGLDPTVAQLATAAKLQSEFGLAFPLIRAGAEAMPFSDASFDLIVSEYGASIWSDPYRWIPEAARVLRPGGELTFLVNGTILMLCMPEAEEAATEKMLRGYFGMHRFEWPGEEAVDFHLGYGDWIRLLRGNGFEVVDLIELRPPEGAAETSFPFVTLEWARRWPSEEIWRARKR